MAKGNPAFTPLVILGADIFGEKNNLPGLADVAILLFIKLGYDERQDRRPIRRGDRDPTGSARYRVVSHQSKSRTVHIESQASILIPNKERGVLKTKVGVVSIQANGGSDAPKR
jgi:hypothetical protein